MSHRLWFVNRFYWPDEPATAQLLTDLAEALAGRGWSVGVVTSHPGSPGVPAREHRHGVAIHRVGGSRWDGGHLGSRIANYLLFFIGAVWRCLRDVRSGDLLVALTDPPLLGVGLWPVAMLRRANLLHWTQDIYPEVAMALARQPPTRWMFSLLRPLRNFTWRHSAGCVTLGRDMAALIARNGVAPDRVALISNWAPVGLASPRSEAVQTLRRQWGVEDKFVIVYSGNLGRVHDLEPVLAVAAALREEPNVVFVFIGSGARKISLETQVRAQCLTNVRFFPPQPRAQLGETLALGDVHLITLRPGCESTVFPSKVYGIAAAARTVLFIGPRDCELAALVRARQLGFAFGRDEIENIAACVRRLAAVPSERQACELAATEFSRKEGNLLQAVTAWETLLMQPMAPGPSSAESPE